MDQDATWYGGKPWPRPYCAGWGSSSLSTQKGAQPPIFGPYLLWPNGWMDQGVTWHGGRPRPKRHCVTWGPSSPVLKRGLPHRGLILCYMGTHSPQKAGTVPPIFGPCLLRPNGRPSQQLLSTCIATRRPASADRTARAANFRRDLEATYDFN